MSDPVRDAIVSILSAIPDIGRVHAFERYANQFGDMSDLYLYNGQLRGWFVRRAAIKENMIGLSPHETITWVIRGYMALSDERQSELEFDGLIDLIRDAFRLNYRLNGTVVTTRLDEEGGIQLDDSGPVMSAGGTLWHSAMLRLMTIRRLPRVPAQ